MKDICKGVVYGGLFLLPFIVIIISNSLFFPYITGKNFAFRIIVEVVFAAWVLLALYDARYRPQFSWILASFLGFLGVMFVANVLGQNPAQSFWSNFERMEGYVTLVHLYMYIVVAGSVLTTEVLWRRYINTIIGVGVLVALYAFAQLSGAVEGDKRLDGTLGNAAYMAIYALFLIFVNVYMFVRARAGGARYIYAFLAALFLYFLVQTATRGTMLGLMGGSAAAVFYIALFAKGHPVARKSAVGVLVALVVILGGFLALKDTPFVQNNYYLERIASISLEDGSVRLTIWGMALEGVKERPLLGWGQGNYNYVFNEFYRPALYEQERWFDRVHNIVFDWLVAGGILGACAYFAIYLSALYYVGVRPLFRKDETFSMVERGMLVGILVGYMIHNFFVFDNIVSYLFYGTLLAYIHARVATPIPQVQNARVSPELVTHILAPVALIICVWVVYVVNVPHMQAAREVIHALQAEDATEMHMWFERALAHNSLGTQEIREQFTEHGLKKLRASDTSEEDREVITQRIEEELLKQISEQPGDARAHVFLSAFYRAVGKIDEARAELVTARALSPEKQAIIFEQGYVEVFADAYPEAFAFFKEAYELGPQFEDARVRYAASAIYLGRMDLVDELIQTDEDKRDFSLDQFAVEAMYHAKLYTRLAEMLKVHVEKRPQDTQARVNLAVVLRDAGNIAEAVAVMEQAGEDIPAFKPNAQKIIESLRTGGGQ